MILLQDIYVRYGKKEILNGISLEIRHGEVVALVGANGAGKSTLLKVLTGQLQPSDGTVFYKKLPIAQWTPTKLAQYRAVVTQNTTIQFPFSVLETVLLGRYSYTNSTQKDNFIIAEQALKAVKMWAFKDRNIQTLSGGEQQRVHFARALAQVWNGASPNSCMLLLDEPTSNLDITYQHQVLKTARFWAQNYNFGVFVIVHDLNLAAQYADQIAFLNKGVLLGVNQPSKILEPSIIQETFGMQAIIQKHPVYDCPQVITY